MAPILNLERLQHAFQGRPDLIGAIQQAAGAPNWIELFNEITSYVSDLRTSASAPSQPASKKRKLEENLPINTVVNGKSTTNGTSNGTVVSHDTDEPSLLQIRDISMVTPQRKKYTLEFTKSYIQARHPDTKELITGTTYAWKDISYAFCLPVPEKAQKQHNYVLFPKYSNLPAPLNTAIQEPLSFTIPATAPKPGTISGSDAGTASAVSDDYKSLFEWALDRALKSSGNYAKIIESDPKHFASVIKEAHRPNEKAVFVKGFRGSKDGYLFFLSTGILWGFKKPLLFLPKARIVAVSYLSVLQRTFNLSVEVYASDTEGGGDEENKEEFEFAMLDQEDFAGIDTYVKRHGLMDTSMAEQRRAKRLGINVVKGEGGEKVDVGDAGELAKAEAELRDEEDEEEEEDYDPGSDGESEGSGTSSEDDDDDDDDDDEGDGGEAEDADDDDGQVEDDD